MSAKTNSFGFAECSHDWRLTQLSIQRNTMNKFLIAIIAMLSLLWRPGNGPANTSRHEVGGSKGEYG